VNDFRPDMSLVALAGSRRKRPTPAWAALLNRFYEPTGLLAPALEEIKAAEVPPPYQSLLVHSWDMTPTLARFYGEAMQLRVFGRERQNQLYRREVILCLAGNGLPVEYGVIRIRLDRLPPAARQLVLREERPLGDILQAEAIPHLSWPQAFFRLKADAHTGAALALRQPGYLYGRRNVLLDGSRQLLAEVIEVLAPVAERRLAAVQRRPAARPAMRNERVADLNHRNSKRTRLANSHS